MITTLEMAEQLANLVDECSTERLLEIYNQVLRPADKPFTIEDVDFDAFGG